MSTIPAKKYFLFFTLVVHDGTIPVKKIFLERMRNRIGSICFQCVVFLFSAGGLVTAVAPVVIECRGLWIGWSGMHDLEPGTPIPEADPTDNAPTAGLLSEQVIEFLV